MRTIATAAPGKPAASERVLGLLLVGGSAVLWSTGGLIVRLIGDLDSWTTVLWRSLFAAVFLAGYLVLRDRASPLAALRRIDGAGLLVGLCFTTASIGFVVALSLTSVANTLIIMSAAPLIAALMGFLFLAERVGRVTWGAIALTMAGIAVMVGGSQHDATTSLLGDAVAVAIAIGWASAIVVTRRNRHVRMTPAVLLAVLIAAAIALPLAAPLSPSPTQMALLLLFGAGQLGLGLILFSTGARLLRASESALIGMLEPILGPLWVWLIVAEHPSTAALIGGAMVLTAVLASTVIERGAQAPA